MDQQNIHPRISTRSEAEKVTFGAIVAEAECALVANVAGAAAVLVAASDRAILRDVTEPLYAFCAGIVIGVLAILAARIKSAESTNTPPQIISFYPRVVTRVIEASFIAAAIGLILLWTS